VKIEGAGISVPFQRVRESKAGNIRAFADRGWKYPCSDVRCRKESWKYPCLLVDVQEL